jgi:SAM-dependent methyltransferase
VTGPTSPRYGLHADRYRRFRPGYPDWLFDRAAELCGPHRQRAVELGAGSGQATPKILERFDHVTAVEPDADMAALIPADPRLTVLVSPAETAPLPEGLDAAFSATAFHWMDAAVVGRRVAQALRPGGVFLGFGYSPFLAGGPDAAVELMEAEHRVWAAHVDTRLSAWRPYAELLRASGAFSRIEDFAFDYERELDPADAAGLFLTTSYAAAHARQTSDEAAYLADLAARLTDATGGAKVTVRFPIAGGFARI